MKRLPTKRKFLGQQMFMGYKFIENGKEKTYVEFKKATLEKIWNTTNDIPNKSDFFTDDDCMLIDISMHVIFY